MIIQLPLGAGKAQAEITRHTHSDQCMPFGIGHDDDRRGIIVVFVRDEIERCDLSRYAATFGAGLDPDRLRDIRSRVSITIAGYENEKAEIYEIPEVRHFFTVAHSVWPSWFYFADLRSPCFYALVVSLLGNLTITRSLDGNCARIQLDPAEVRERLEPCLGPLAFFHAKTATPRQSGATRLKNLAAYLNIPNVA